MAEGLELVYWDYLLTQALSQCIVPKLQNGIESSTVSTSRIGQTSGGNAVETSTWGWEPVI